MQFPASSRDALVFCPHCRQKLIVPTLGADDEAPENDKNWTRSETFENASAFEDDGNASRKNSEIEVDKIQADDAKSDETDFELTDERDFGVPVASYLSPEPDRLKPTRRFRVGVGFDASPCVSSNPSSNVFNSPLREASISDDEFIRRLRDGKNAAQNGAADSDRRRVRPTRSPRATSPTRTDRFETSPEEEFAEGRGGRKRPRVLLGVAWGIVLPFALLVGVLGWRSYLEAEIEREGKPSVAPLAPIFLDGALTYRTSTGSVEGDAGAFVFLFPTDVDFGDSLPLGGAVPGRKLPANFDDFLEKLKKRGGYFAVAEFDGRFSISLKNSGEYDVLLVSRNVERTPNAADSAALKEISRYLYSPEQSLLANRRFLWKQQNIDYDSAIIDENFGTRSN